LPSPAAKRKLLGSRSDEPFVQLVLDLVPILHDRFLEIDVEPSIGKAEFLVSDRCMLLEARNAYVWLLYWMERVGYSRHAAQAISKADHDAFEAMSRTQVDEVRDLLVKDYGLDFAKATGPARECTDPEVVDYKPDEHPPPHVTRRAAGAAPGSAARSPG
jgi:hypothetical protein